MKHDNVLHSKIFESMNLKKENEPCLQMEIIKKKICTTVEYLRM